MMLRTRARWLTAVIVLASACSRTPQRYLEQANQLYGAGRLEEASLNYRKAIQMSAQFGEAYYRLGLCEVKRERYLEALGALRQAVRLMPGSEEPRVALANLCLSGYVASPERPKSLYDELAKQASGILENNPRSYDGFRLKGQIATLDRRFEEAADWFRKAHEVRPWQPEVILGLTQSLIGNQNYAQAERWALDLIAMEPQFGLMYDKLYGMYVGTNRIGDAERLLQHKVSSAPKSAGNLLQLAGHYAAQRQPERVSETLKRLTDNRADFPQGRLQAGDFYRELKDWSNALRQYEEGARLEPGGTVFLVRRAEVLAAQGKVDQALADLEALEKGRPPSDEVALLQARLWLAMNTPKGLERAAESMRTLRTRKPSDAGVRYQLGRILLAKGDLDAAHAEFLEAARLSGRFVEPRLALAELSLTRRQTQNALRYAGEGLVLDPNNRAARVLRAAGLRQNGQVEEARQTLNVLQREFPEDRDTLLQQAQLHIAERRYLLAEQLLQKLRQRRRSDLSVVQATAAMHLAQGEAGRALRLLEDEMTRSANPASVRALRAETAMVAGSYAMAAADYEWLARANPGSAALQARLGEALRLGGDHRRALECYRKARELDRSSPAIATALARLLQAAGESQAARALCEEMLAQQPDDPATLNNVAFLLAESGQDLDRALQLAQRAQSRMPEEPQIQDTLALIYLRKNMADRALQILTGLVQRKADNPEIRYHLGLALSQKGQKQQARKELMTALASGPDRSLEAQIRQLLEKL